VLAPFSAQEVQVPRCVCPLVLALVFLSACGGSGSDSPNDVSEPAIDERFAVDADGRQLALLCYGEGSPTVFLEPGDGGSGDEFSYVMRPLGERTTTCTYDRPGFGRSDPPSKARRTLDDATGDLHALIEAVDLPVPFVHVGASGGGYIALYYASRYRNDVAGVVLLDVSQDDPKEGAKIFPGAKAWRDPEHLDNVGAARRMMRLPPLALEDIPLRVITAAEGPASAEKNQSAWLKRSSDAQQTTLPGGHDLAEENTEGVSPRSESFSTRSKTRYGSDRTACSARPPLACALDPQVASSSGSSPRTSVRIRLGKAGRPPSPSVVAAAYSAL
jgi:pimeloyl-ACP methyl ester carboxylesterase